MFKLLKERFKEDLLLAGYTKGTIKVYSNSLIHIGKFYKCSPDKLSRDQLRGYVKYVIEIKKLSRTSIKQIIRSLELFYKLTLKRNWEDLGIVKPPRKRSLPVVLTKDEVNKILSSIKNLKHKTIVTVIYSSGIRLGEALSLKVSDIDSKRMMIRIRNGKFQRERYAILSRKTLKLLRQYWLKYKPEDWLFPSGQLPDRALTRRTVQRELKKAIEKAGIKNKHVVCHTLRHSFAAHLMDSGVNIRIIQELLGHLHIKSTLIYTHVTSNTIQKVKSPFDEA